MTWGEVSPGMLVLWAKKYGHSSWFVLSVERYVYRNRHYVKVKVIAFVRSDGACLMHSISTHSKACVLVDEEGTVVV